MSQEIWDAAEMERWLPLVRGVASRMKRRLPRFVEFDDLVQWGCLGLASAMRNYDPNRGVKFGAFARQRIGGSILDGLRGMEWIPKHARATGESFASIGRMTCDAVATLPPTGYFAEVAEEVDLVLNRLDGGERDLVESRYIREEPVESIATRHGITSRNVRIRLARILAQLRESRVRRVRQFRAYNRVQPTVAASRGQSILSV